MSNVAEVESYPATPMQIGMIFSTLAEPDLGENIVQIRISLEENVDVNRLIHSWNTETARHPALNTVFRWDGLEKPQQVVVEQFNPTWTVLDWDALSADEIADEKSKLLDHDRTLGFDLNVAPPYRFYIAKESEDCYWFFWSIHHVLLDGRSFVQMLKNSFDRYDNKQPDLSVTLRPFSDYANLLETTDYSESSTFWTEYLANVESDRFVPINKPLGAICNSPTRANAAVEKHIPADLSQQLRTLGKTHRVGMVTIVQSAWALLLHHYSQQDSVVFGTTRGLRHTIEGGRDTVGLLINTIPTRIEFTDTLKVSDLLPSVRAEQKLLRKVEKTPLAIIQKCAAFESHSLFDSLVVYDEKTFNNVWHSPPSAQPPNRQLTQENQTNDPLALLAFGENEIFLRLQYQVENYDSNFCQTLLDQLENIFVGFVEQPDAVAVKLPYLTDRETDQLKVWNDSTRDFSSDKCVHELIEQWAEETPDATAIAFENESVTYTELNVRANRLAHHLIEQGVKSEDPVGIFMERSAELIIGLLAVLKAGGVYVPLDPKYPPDRLEYILNDVSVVTVLTQQDLMPSLSSVCPTVPLIYLDGNNILSNDGNDSNPDVDATSNQLMYILYTSGSTGKPKGVGIVHRSVVCRVSDPLIASFGSDEISLHLTPLTFDPSIPEIWGALANGGQLVVMRPGTPSLEELGETIKQRSVSIWFTTTALFNMMADHRLDDLKSLKVINFGGDVASVSHVKRAAKALKNTTIINAYGPTENATISSCFHVVDAESLQSTVPIGRPASNTQIYILDKHMSPVPVGVVGEMYLGGTGLAREYINRPELTQERFVINPFGDGRLYKSGDLASYRSDGNIEFLGRNDFQVKLRGFRIELGEIEAIIATFPQVKEALVSLVTTPSKEQEIVAYVVTDDFDPAALREHSGKSLASFMVPTFWVKIDHIPLTSSGKVDRKQLPMPDFTVGRSTDALAMPTNEIERKLHEVWQEILGTNNIGTNDAFFDVGGNSLLLIRLSNRLTEVFDKKFPLQLLLRETTIGKQAGYITTPNTASDKHVTTATTLAEKQKAARKRRRRPRPDVPT